MGLFDNFFRKNKKTEKTKSGNEFELLMIDWFSDAKLNYKTFQNEFEGKVYEIFITQNYIQEKISESEQDDLMLRLNIAFIYLIYHYPDKKLLHRLHKLFHKNRQTYARNYFNTSFANDAYKTYPKFKFIHKTVRIIWSLNYKIVDNRDPFNDVSTIIQLKYEDSESFIRVLNYIKDIQSENRLTTLLNIYLSRSYSNREISEKTQNQIYNILKTEVDIYNKNNFFKLDIDFYKKLDDLYFYKDNFEKWHQAKYDERNDIPIDDFTALLDFVSKNDIKKLIKHYVFAYNHRSNYDSFNKKFLIYLREKLIVDEKILLEILQIYSKNNSLLIEELFIPLATQLNISYNSETRKELEQLIITQSTTKQSDFAIFHKIANTIKDKTKREVIKGKYSADFAVINTSGYNWTAFNTDNKPRLKKKLKDVSKIVELAVVGIKDEYIDLYQTYIKIIYKDTVKKITYQEINPILNENNTGFQLVPIPIKVTKVIDEEHHKGKNYLCSLSFLNKAQYDYLINNYLPENFPEIDIEFFYDRNYKYNYNNPLTFEEYLKEKSNEKDTSNKFLTDNNWKWFKERYIDTLPNFKEWYEIMNIIINYSGSRKPSKKWLKEIDSIIKKHGIKKYYRELQTLIGSSINEDFWYFDTNRNALKGIAASCSLYNDATSLMILKQIIEKSYTKIPNVGPRSGAIGNFALEVLISHPNSDSFGILNLLRNQTKYTRFANVLDKYINKYIETSEEEEEVLADKAIPDFGFKNGIKIVNYDKFAIKYFIKNRKIVKKWIVNEKEIATTPSFIKENFPKIVKEISAELKSYNSFLKTTKTRIRSYWLNNREWSFENWKQNIKQKEMINPWLQGLIWKNETQKNSFILIDNELYDFNNNIMNPDKDDIITLWHPISETDEEIVNWQKFVIDNKINQSERQVFREFYPFTKNELELEITPRFNHHFLNVNKLMAIANASGWVFTYVHEDVNWPRTYIKALNITAHLKCDYNRNDFAIPTKGFFITQGDTRKISFSSKFNNLTFDKIPQKTLSEICRDVDLFIATTSVAHDINLSKKTELLQHYREDFSMGKFSDNAQAKIRKQIINLIGDKIGLQSFGFEKNYLLITGKWNTYSINLGSGFAQIKDTKRHIPIIPEVAKIKKTVNKIIPIIDDETLYIILAKAIFLQNEEKITDNKIIELLKTV